jgi:hypothetical protein
MKKNSFRLVVIFLLVSIMTFPLFVQSFAPSNGEIFKIIRLNINKKVAYINIETEVAIDVPPMIVSNRTFVPLRFIAEAFNSQVDWNDKKREITITLGTTEIKLWIGDRMTTIKTDRDVYNFELDAAPFIRSGRTLIPIRFVAETFQCKVDWFKDQQMVVIYFVPSVKGYSMDLEVKINDPKMSLDVSTFVMSDPDHIVYIGEKYNDDVDYGVIEKLSLTGKSIWRQEYKDGWFLFLEKMSDGSFVAVGGIRDTMYLFKFSANGKEILRKNLGTDIGDYEDFVYLPNKGFIVVGDQDTRYAPGEKMQNYCEGLILGLDLQGNKIWSKTYKTPGFVNGFFCIEKFVGSNHCIIGGCFGKSQPGFMIIDEDGNQIVQKSIPNMIGYFNSICNTYDDMFLLTGNMRFSMKDDRSNSFYSKVDQSGKVKLERKVSEYQNNRSESIVPLANGDYVMTGHTHTNTSAGQNLLTIYDKDGNKKDQFVWGSENDMFIHRSVIVDDGSFVSMGCGENAKGIRSIFIYQHFPLFFEL